MDLDSNEKPMVNDFHEIYSRYQLNWERALYQGTDLA